MENLECMISDEALVEHIIQSINLKGNQKIKVLKFLIENRNKENLIIMTQKEISQKCNVGSQTVARTVKTLQNAKFLIRIINGTYEIKLA